MTTVDHGALIADMTARRPDAVRPADSPEPRTLTPFAARLHRIARLIADEHLPEASIALGPDSVLIAALDGLIENTVRRWAAAIGEVVTEAPCDMPDGTAGTQWAASGWDSHGDWWFIQGRAAVPAVTR